MLQVCVCSMRIEFNLRHNMQIIVLFLNILVDSWKHQNGRVDVNPLMHFQAQRKHMLLKTH